MNKIKFQILLLVMVPFFFNCATNNNSKQSGEDCYFDKEVGFSICFPETYRVDESWKKQEWWKHENLRVKTLIVSTENNDQPMIMFAEERTDKTFGNYVDSNIRSLKEKYADIKIQRSDFFTNKNLKGQKLLTTFTHTQSGKLLRMTHFLFPGQNGVHMVIACSVPRLPADVSVKYDELFNKTVKTFEWTK
jgi:hypothetical protein